MVRDQLKVILENIDHMTVFQDNKLSRLLSSSFVERFDYDKFSQAFPFKIYSESQRYHLDQAAKFLCLLDLDIDKTAHLDCRSEKFRDFIEDKSIAIVGPAPSGTDISGDIDKFDVVVRCNIAEEDFGEKNPNKGDRCDISYLSVAHGKSLVNARNALPSDVKFLCFKNQKTYNDFKKTQNETLQKLNCRYYNSINPILLTGTSNLIQGILIDILNHQPSFIKIFCADMMITKDRHIGYHSILRNTPQAQTLHAQFCTVDNSAISDFRLASGAAHDPLSNFFVMKTLKASNRILCNPRLDEILQLSEREYMEKLDNLYGVLHNVAYR